MNRSVSAWPFLWPLLLILALAVLATFASNVSAQVLPDVDSLPRTWKLRAREVSANRNSEIVEARGEVVLESEGVSLKADFARYFASTDWIYLQGNVTAVWDTYTLNAERAEFDIKDGVGWLYNGRLSTSDPEVYLSGERIEKRADETYFFKEAKVTSCQGDRPAWSFTVGEADITVEDEARLGGPVFRIFDVPVLYLPYIQFSISSERTSGLLYPEFGQSTDLGVTVLQPIYWVIDEESDLTLYEYYMSERGLMQGAEYRLAPDSRTKGYLRGDWLYDNETSPEVNDPDDQFGADPYARPNHNRYWVRGMYDASIFDTEWTTKIDLDYVSDQDYLREFKHGLSGYNHSRKELLRNFGRTLAVNDSLIRISAGLLSRSWDLFGFNAKAEYNEHLAYRNGNLDETENPTLQRLPELTLYQYKEQLWESPLELVTNVEGTHFWREAGTRGFRMEAFPRLSLPWSTPYISLIPSAGWRQRFYSLEYEESSEEAGADEFQESGIPELNLAAYSGFHRTFDLGDAPAPGPETTGDSSWTGLRHTVQPRVEYNWVPSKDQSELPEFDTKDRIEPANEIFYSLINILDRKTETVRPIPEDDGRTRYELAPEIREAFRLRLEQSYDIREARREEALDRYERRPFSDLMAEIILNPSSYLTLTNTTFYSPYLGIITDHEHSATLSWSGVGSVSFGMDFLEPVDEYKRQVDAEITTLNFGATFTYFDHWDISGRYEVDLITSTDIEKEINIVYKHQCFDFGIGYWATRFDEAFLFTISLTGVSSTSLSF